MNPRIVGVAGPFQGAVFPLTGAEVAIGREPSSQLCIVDPSLSRRHCLLAQQDGRFTLRDLGSRNGTLVNGVPVEEQELKHGDQISVGDSVLVFLLEEGDAVPRSNPVQFTDTVELENSPVLLRPEDALYLQPEQIAGLPQTARLTRDLNTLLKIAISIGGIRTQESLQWQVLGLVFDVVPAERGAILLFDTDDFGATVAWDRARGPGHRVQVSRTVVERVVRERAGLVVGDVSGDESLRKSRSLADASLCSLLCVPVIASGKILGAIYLDSSNPAERFDESHLQMMTAVAGICSLALENVRHCEQLQRENQELRAEIGLEHNLVGGSSRMREVFDFIRRTAPTDSTVLIQGESGTGKELVARAMHRNSPRANRPFVAINCAAITETLLESELFGHEKGAFTGASAQKRGKVEAADGGTLFLDEIGELASTLQSKLLRVLQEREFERVGGTRPVKVDIRLIAATNKSLPEAVKAGSFRNDLYYRLNVLSVTMPALRERREDIPLLAEHFITKTSRRCKTRVKALSPEARAFLMMYDWPGNVRELENAIERALVLGPEDVILPDDLPEPVLETGSAASSPDYYRSIKDFKKQLVVQALRQTSGSYVEAAKALGVHPNSLLRLIRNLQIKAPEKAS